MKPTSQSKININDMAKYICSSFSLPFLVYDDALKLQILNDAALSFFEIESEKEDITINSIFRLEANEVFQFEGNHKNLNAICIPNQAPCTLTIDKIINDYSDVIGYIILVNPKTDYVVQAKTDSVNVLIVDDNLINLQIAQEIISSCGLIADTACGGQEAIDLCRQKHYPLIFMDLMMPEIDGTAAMKQIRLLDSYYAPGGEGKIIVLTADTIAGVREQLLERGFDEYLTKPINMAQLEKLLIRYLPDTKISVTDRQPSALPVDDSPLQNEDIIYLQNTLPMINVKKGIGFCGKNVPDYLNILKLTFTHGEKHLSDLKTLWENKDYENYTIKIHSMKSTSLNIGAEGISNMALSQEMAGKEKRFSYIDETYHDFQASYRELLKGIQEVLSHYRLLPETTVKDRPALEDNVMSGILTNIRRLLDEFDFDKIFELLEQIDNYQPNEKQKAFFERLKILMDDLNIDEIYLLLDSYTQPD